MESLKSKDRLDHKITLVHELLRKHRLTEQIVHNGDSPRKELLESILHRQNLVELEQKLKRMHTADLAHIIELLPPEDRLIVWSRVCDQCGGEILLEVSEAVRKNLVNDMSEDQIQSALRQMDGDDLAFIADDVPDAFLQMRLASLSSEEQDWILASLNYSEGTVGDLMSNEMVIVHETDTLGQAELHLRSLRELPIHNDKLFVIDLRGLFKGVLPLQSILLNEPDVRVADVMVTKVVRFAPYDDASDASMAFERYDLISAPVVNARGKLLGRLTVDVVMDYLRERSGDDVLNMAGVEKDEDLFSPLMDSVKNRGVWLVINLFTAFIASRVIGVFEDTIVQLVALAALMPIIASVGGNTGNQTSALIIRAMSKGQITDENTKHLFRKEVGVSAINGLMLGTAVGLFALVFYQDVALALVISVAMLLTLIVAAVLGMVVPVLINKSGRDPALGSSVILTATTDSIGFFIFLGLAALFLV
jgi:magnesium transporter